MAAFCRRLAVVVHKDHLFSGNGSYLDVFEMVEHKLMCSIHLPQAVEIRQLFSVAEGIVLLGHHCLLFVTDERIFSAQQVHGVSAYSFDVDPWCVQMLPDDCMAVLYSDWKITLHRILFVPGQPIMTALLGTQSLSFQDIITSAYIRGNSWSTLVTIIGTKSGIIAIHAPKNGPLCSGMLQGATNRVNDIDVFDGIVCAVTSDKQICFWDDTPLEYALVDSYHWNYNMIATSYGHSKKIRLVCHDSENFYYTIGDDDQLRVWLFEDGRPNLKNERDIKAGRALAILIHEDTLYICYDSCALVYFKIADLRMRHERWRTIPNIHSFARIGTDLFAVSAKFSTDDDGDVYQYVKRSPTFIVDQNFMAHVGDHACKFYMNEKWLKWTFKEKVASVTMFGKCALIFKVNHTADLLSVEGKMNIGKISLKKAIKELRLKGPVFISSMTIALVGNRQLYLILGSKCGNVFFCKYAYGQQDAVCKTMKELNKHFSRKPISHMHSAFDELVLLGHNGNIVFCTLDLSNNPIKLVTSRPICPWLKGFRPCCFTPDVIYVLGFRGSMFYVINYMKHQIVYKIDCGGIRRQWNFHVVFPYAQRKQEEIPQQDGQQEIQEDQQEEQRDKIPPEETLERDEMETKEKTLEDIIFSQEQEAREKAKENPPMIVPEIQEMELAMQKLLIEERKSTGVVDIKKKQADGAENRQEKENSKVAHEEEESEVRTMERLTLNSDENGVVQLESVEAHLQNETHFRQQSQQFRTDYRSDGNRNGETDYCLTDYNENSVGNEYDDEEYIVEIEDIEDEEETEGGSVESSGQPLQKSKYGVTAILEFLRKKNYNSITMVLSPIRYVVGPLHRRKICALRILVWNEFCMYGVTVSEDHFMHVFRFDAGNSGWITPLAFYTPSHPTCVERIEVKVQGWIIIVGTANGVIMAYSIRPCNFVRAANYVVPSVEFKRKGANCRVVHLDIANKHVRTANSYLCVVSYGDGKIICLDIAVNAVTMAVEIKKSSDFGTLASKKDEIFEKVQSWKWNSLFYICAATSNGHMFLWKANSNFAAKQVASVRVDNRRLISLATVGCESRRFVAVGSDTGRITVYRIVGGESLAQLAIIKFFDESVGGLALELDGEILRIHAAYELGMYAVYQVDVEEQSEPAMVYHYRSSVLHPKDLIADPYVGGIVVGDGMEIITSASRLDSPSPSPTPQ
uniref:tRNA (34-2'-O)-methyltransferase regulator WDR6 n=1 Tax=Haemonchus contortus TaxID=6289 RepID=A0A7I4YYP4_HAECO